MKKNLLSNTGQPVIFILFYVLFACTLSAAAQKDSVHGNRYYLWANVGVNGGFSANSSFLSGVQLGLNLSLNQKHFFRVNSYASGTVEFMSKPPNELRYIRNVSCQYGVIHYYSGSTAIIFAAGISGGEALWRGDFLYYDQSRSTGVLSSTGNIYEMDRYYYWGIPVDLTILWTAPRSGFSIDVYANFHKHSDYGLRLNYDIGRIRDRPLRRI